MCYTHAYPFSPYLPLKKPQITGESMRLSEGNPCGPDCFRLVPDIEKYAESLPPPSSEVDQTSLTDDLSVILGIAPDLFPCQLSVLCFKSCKEIFVKHLQLFPDNTILPLDRESSAALSTDGESGTERGTVVERKKKKSRPVMQCGLSCNGHHVHARSVKILAALVQWGKGSVFQVFVSDVMLGSRRNPCSNTRMHRQDSKLLEIKAGSHGLGAFATEDMVADAFLGTYVGHTLTNNAAEHTSEIMAHNGCNYLFEFSVDAEIFDAAQVWNLTRFLNHKGNRVDNVDATSVLVNGEHQIGFFTSGCSSFPMM
ncbi:hypothetical protein EDC04DRAFT_2612979 [Pisolithus marmoratus]|nr:hypothetical protein EDC04DRAFT_2612979 [Pisolithus marmoratus]